MSTKLLRVSHIVNPSLRTRAFSSTRLLPAKVDAYFISQITAAEKALANSDELVEGGPTAHAQAHEGEEITAEVIRAINEGERIITGRPNPTRGGPTSVAQMVYTSTLSSTRSSASVWTPFSQTENSATINSVVLARITAAEMAISGQDEPATDGPTAEAQRHFGKAITGLVLRDIVRGEKKITGGMRVKGGPTAMAQQEMRRSMQSSGDSMQSSLGDDMQSSGDSMQSSEDSMQSSLGDDMQSSGDGMQSSGDKV